MTVRVAALLVVAALIPGCHRPEPLPPAVRLAEQARVARRAGDLESSIRLAQQVVELRPTWVGVRMELAYDQVALGRYEQADASLDGVIGTHHNRNPAPAWALSAEVNRQLGRTARAVAALERVTWFDGKNVAAHELTHALQDIHDEHRVPSRAPKYCEISDVWSLDARLAYKAVTEGEADFLAFAWRHLRDAQLTPHGGSVLGEVYVRSMLLLQRVQPAHARDAAAGWDGDLLLVYGKSPDVTATSGEPEAPDGDGRRGTALVLQTTWDTADDAAEFFSAYATLLETKYADLNVLGSNDADPNTLRFTCGDELGEGVLRLRGREVFAVEGFDPELTNAVLRDLESLEIAYVD